MTDAAASQGFLDSPATPRFVAGVAGLGAVAVAAWFSLIAAHQASYYDPLCGNVGAVAGERYAQCMTKTFSGTADSVEADYAAAVAHLEAEGFVAAPVGDRSFYHPGSILRGQDHASGMLVLDIDNGRLQVAHEALSR